MSEFTLMLATTIGISLAIQGWLVLGFCARMRSPKRQLLADAQCPQAEVVVCLRGGDPFLHRCVDAVLRQDYPRYRVLFVVDHECDPALGILRASLAQTNPSNHEVQFLSQPRSTCSLKCSSLVQAYRSLLPETEFLAQLDADTIPHRSWLRELATGLAEENIGAVTGNRWYAPENPTQGALVRHVWNAAAIVQMSWYRIAWGGTLAIKTSVIRDAKLEEHWSLALCEDTMLSSHLAKIGKRVEFTPSLIMTNREDCTIRSFLPWVTRQLLTARLYHRAWPLVVVHGIASAAILIAGWCWASVLAVMGQVWHAAAVAVVMVAFQLVLLLLVRWIGRAVESALAREGRAERWDRPGILRWFWVVTITQGVYSWALVRCLASRSTNWRGIVYRVAGPWRITMDRYQPYSESVGSVPARTKDSL
jgi:cellulose synthase/poly-beta-1,6-N-acetylglucosamine synthase-like glycosyltransferase